MFRLFIRTVVWLVRTVFRSRDDLVLENLALRQQLAIYKDKRTRPERSPRPGRNGAVVAPGTFPKYPIVFLWDPELVSPATRVTALPGPAVREGGTARRIRTSPQASEAYRNRQTAGHAREAGPGE